MYREGERRKGDRGGERGEEKWEGHTEIFLSLEPCAIASIFISLSPKAPKNFAARPGVFTIWSPTAAKMQQSEINSTFE
jgi:hypothetical protein